MLIANPSFHPINYLTYPLAVRSAGAGIRPDALAQSPAEILNDDESMRGDSLGLWGVEAARLDQAWWLSIAGGS